MNKEKITKIFENYVPKPIGIERSFSVLISLIEIEDSIHLLFEQRADHLIRQPGEISFPGGKIEVGETPENAVIREACEELNIEPDLIEILGSCDYLVTPFNDLIHSFVGLLKVDLEKIKPNIEVEYIFTVPLEYFLVHKPLKYEAYITPEINEVFPYELIPKGKEYEWRVGKYPIYFYIYENYIIWGITARFTYEFIRKLKL
ncbi:MAG TPA: CoA pyrophosphatase [Defluviitoga sp.]|nr:CoA pyrophosphatase [Defluviitoga sp.]HOP23767.1 CoA pyrophosphatase [Defluviitoga sp.]HPZ28486.1 CoA pyrophosphatase [Defluviitoga sp.]HQD62780.1 CoA pyrophosphatase [Defluviitoga sp.]